MSAPSDNQFAKPTPVDDVDLAFGGDVRKLMPKYEDIPDEFKRRGNPYVRFQVRWFYDGLEDDEIPPAKDGIDQRAALRHLGAIQGSWEPKHEHKQAAVAYLASLWLETPNV